MTRRDTFVWYAEKQIGKVYSWGGDDPIAGFDCSGLVIECGQAVGIFPAKYDNTAAGLYAKFVQEGKKIAAVTQPGCLVFWSKTDADSIHHVEIAWNALADSPFWVSIGASGGASTTTSVLAAVQQNAFVKVRPITARGFNMFFADPFL